MGPRDWLRAVRRARPTRRTYDLDVVDQWLIVLLDRFAGSTYRRLEAELAALRGTPPAEVVAALIKLEGLTLIEREAPQTLLVGEPRFLLSRAGRRLRALVPAEPRSPTIFYP